MISVLNDDELFRQAAELFAESAHEAVSEKGTFTVALSCGETPRRLFMLLADEYRRSIPWHHVQVFFGDERCVPPNHSGSNFLLANETLLSKVDIPTRNVHRMMGELEPALAAAEYATELRNAFPVMEIPRFDLILLGLGDNAHTASIFPGSPLLKPTKEPVAAVYVPEVEMYRLTVTPPVLQNARRLIFLVTGSEKAQAVHDVIEGEFDPDRFPAQIVRASTGEVIWLIDPDAAHLLNTRALAA